MSRTKLSVGIREAIDYKERPMVPDMDERGGQVLHAVQTFLTRPGWEGGPGPASALRIAAPMRLQSPAHPLPPALPGTLEGSATVGEGAWEGRVDMQAFFSFIFYTLSLI